MMKKLWTVKEQAGQEYFYSVKAEDEQEAIEKVEKGEAGMAIHTQELPVTYTVYPVVK